VDQTLVFRAGEIAERGTHEQLLAATLAQLTALRPIEEYSDSPPL
jgi:hypothetical protein